MYRKFAHVFNAPGTAGIEKSVTDAAAQKLAQMAAKPAVAHLTGQYKVPAALDVPENWQPPDFYSVPPTIGEQQLQDARDLFSGCADDISKITLAAGALDR